MGLAELIESGKMSDALILTVGLIEKSEHENVDVDALLGYLSVYDDTEWYSSDSAQCNTEKRALGELTEDR